MIKVKIERSRSSNRINAFSLSGHADAGPYGYDLVCAAVSALSFGAINAIIKLCDVKLPVETGEEGGFLRCEIPDGLQEETNEKVQLLLEGMLVSLGSLEREYRKHIIISDKKKS